MKHLLAALLVSVSVVADAQVVQPMKPVDVAARLYSDCLKADLMSAQIVPTRVGIIEYAEEVDGKCVAWMVIWYNALLGKSLGDLPKDDIARLERATRGQLQILVNELRTEALR